MSKIKLRRKRKFRDVIAITSRNEFHRNISQMMLFTGEKAKLFSKESDETIDKITNDIFSVSRSIMPNFKSSVQDVHEYRKPNKYINIKNRKDKKEDINKSL